MAPKRQLTKAMKRPATAVNSRRTSHPRRVKSARPGVIKTPATAARTKCLRPRAILKAFSKFEEIPKRLRDDLESFINSGVREDQLHRMQTTVAAFQDHLRDGEDRLLTNLRDAQKVVDGLAADKNARAKAERDAEIELAKLTQAVADGRLALKSSGNMADAAHNSLEDAKVAHKACESELQGLRSKRALLQNTAMSTYGPLKEGSAGGAKGQKQLKTLCKIGQDFGFHDVLIGALPAILRKQPDKRRTFDGIAMTQLDTEFEKQGAKLDSAIQDQEASLSERSMALRVAQDSFANAKCHQQNSAQAVEEISSALGQAKESLVSSRKLVRSYARDASQAERTLKIAKAKLSSFRTGPLAAFGELQTFLAPMKLECTSRHSTTPRELPVAVAETLPGASLTCSAAVLPVTF